MYNLDLLPNCLNLNINVTLLFRYLHVSFSDLLKELKKKDVEISVLLLKENFFGHSVLIYRIISEPANTSIESRIAWELPEGVQREQRAFSKGKAQAKCEDQQRGFGVYALAK